MWELCVASNFLSYDGFLLIFENKYFLSYDGFLLIFERKVLV